MLGTDTKLRGGGGEQIWDHPECQGYQTGETRGSRFGTTQEKRLTSEGGCGCESPAELVRCGLLQGARQLSSGDTHRKGPPYVFSLSPVSLELPSTPPLARCLKKADLFCSDFTL